MKPFDKEHTQKIRQSLAEKYNIEMTNDELIKKTKEAFNIIREEMRKKGYNLSNISDEQLFHLLRKTHNE